MNDRFFRVVGDYLHVCVCVQKVEPMRQVKFNDRVFNIDRSQLPIGCRALFWFIGFFSFIDFSRDLARMIVETVSERKVCHFSIEAHFFFVPALHLELPIVKKHLFRRYFSLDISKWNTVGKNATRERKKRKTNRLDWLSAVQFNSVILQFPCAFYQLTSSLLFAYFLSLFFHFTLVRDSFCALHHLSSPI